MDNFRIDITCEGETALRAALEICSTQYRTVCGYRVDDKHGLVLYWTDSSKSRYARTPYKYTIEDTLRLVMGWLKERSDSEYDNDCDHDGHNGRGWRVYNEGWGHVGGEYQAFLAVRPNWAWYGK